MSRALSLFGLAVTVTAPPTIAQNSFVIPSKAGLSEPGLVWSDAAPQLDPFWGTTGSSSASIAQYLYDVRDIPEEEIQDEPIEEPETEEIVENSEVEDPSEDESPADNPYEGPQTNPTIGLGGGGGGDWGTRIGGKKRLVRIYGGGGHQGPC